MRVEEDVRNRRADREKQEQLSGTRSGGGSEKHKETGYRRLERECGIMKPSGG